MMNEIHPLVFCDLYEKSGGFKKYTCIELYCLFSCFYELKQDDALITSDEYIKYIQERIIYYEEKENISLNNLQFIMYDYVKNWMELCDDEQSCLQFINEFKSRTNLFIGDFIKCCLKLIHISDELTSICEHVGNYECLDKVKEGKHKIMKFIMNNQSLYL